MENWPEGQKENYNAVLIICVVVIAVFVGLMAIGSLTTKHSSSRQASEQQ